MLRLCYIFKRNKKDRNCDVFPNRRNILED